MQRNGPINWGNPLNRAHPLARGPLSLWLPEPGRSGNTLFDIGRNVTATLTNGAALGVTGALGQRGDVVLDGSNDYIDLGTAPAPGSALTIGCWVKTSGTGLTIFAACGPNGSDNFWFATNGGVLQISVLGPGTTGGTVGVGVWTFAMATYDGATYKIYQDGVEVASASQSGSITATNVVFGQFGNAGFFFPGSIAGMMYANRVFTAAEAYLWFDESRSGYPNLLNRMGVPLYLAAAPAGYAYNQVFAY